MSCKSWGRYKTWTVDSGLDLASSPGSPSAIRGFKGHALILCAERESLGTRLDWTMDWTMDLHIHALPCTLNNVCCLDNFRFAFCGVD